MFKAAIDGFGRVIAGVGVVEVGQDAPGSAFECPAQRDDLREGRGTPAPMVKLLPGAPAALAESIPGKVYDVEGVHDAGF